MANHRSHINKALHNEKLIAAGYLDTEYPDWYITVHFYAAVHWIRAYLSLNGCCQGEHADLHYDSFQIELRKLAVQSKKDNPKSKLPSAIEKAIDEFRDLKSLSRNSRYRCDTLPSYARSVHEAELALRNIRQFVTGNGITP